VDIVGSMTAFMWTSIVGRAGRGRQTEGEGTISLGAAFALGADDVMAGSRTQGSLLLSSASPRRGSTDQLRGLRDTTPIEVSLHHHAGGHTSTEATCSMDLAHWYREQHAIIRSVIWFVVFATALYLFFGPIGILYALGLEAVYLLIYLLATAFASLLYPDVY
jgi:hypothetical protein